MQKPNVAASAAVGAVTETFDFVKKMWGGMGIPGMVAPTLSVDEIDRKIADLRAVESWLTLNMNMLRGTIQGLEVQRGTLSALQSMGLALGAAGKPSDPPAPPFESPFESPFAAAATAAGAPAAAPAAASGMAGWPDLNAAPVNPNAWWNLLQEQFRQAVSRAVAQPAAADTAAGTAPAASAAAEAAEPAKVAKPAKPAARPRKPS